MKAVDAEKDKKIASLEEQVDALLRVLLAELCLVEWRLNGIGRKHLHLQRIK